jgi:hypothetical protein
MNKIKDTLYDINDILIAVLILCCAVLIIFSRVNAIMTFPEKTAYEQGSQGGRIQIDVPEGPEADEVFPGAEDGAGDDDVSEEEPAAPADGVKHTAFSLYIAPGESMTEVAGDLVKLGFFEDTQDFINTLLKHNAGTKVQAGEFVLPADSTKDDIVKIITGAM